MRIDHLNNIFGVESKDMFKPGELADLNSDCRRSLRKPATQGGCGTEPQQDLIVSKALGMVCFVLLATVQQIEGCAKLMVASWRQFNILAAPAVDELGSQLFFEFCQLLRDSWLRKSSETRCFAD
ncbi:MAG: hypothetical protein P8N72_12840 [Flavimaricola sp.]|nr:hypothetical protein [Flavimaricola sp.]